MSIVKYLKDEEKMWDAQASKLVIFIVQIISRQSKDNIDLCENVEMPEVLLKKYGIKIFDDVAYRDQIKSDVNECLCRLENRLSP